MQDGRNFSTEFEAPGLMGHDIFIFPFMEVAMTIQGSRNVASIQQALKENRVAVFIPPKSSWSSIGRMGTLVSLREAVPLNEGMLVSLKGLWRVRIQDVIEGKGFRVRFTKAEESDVAPQGRPKVMEKVHRQIDEFVRLIPGIPTEIINVLKNAETPGKLADLCAYSPQFTLEERAELLETLDGEERLTKVSVLFEQHLNGLKRLAKVKTIPECETCMDLADNAFESGRDQRTEVTLAFLNHVVKEHTPELLAILVEKYGPVFLRKRELR